MPGISFDPAPNQNQGFNFSKDVQDTFGYLQTLTIGSDATGANGIVIPADIAIKHPGLATPDATEKVVGILTKVEWMPGSAPGDPIEFNFQVSTKNKMKLAELVHQKLESIDCQFNFCVWEYDPLQKKYFKALWNDDQSSKPMKSLIYKEGGKDLQLKVGTKGTEVQAPENWSITLKVVSQPILQKIIYATGIQQGQTLYNVIKQWGVAVGA